MLVYADAALDPFDFDVTADYNLGGRPNQSYDFSQTYTFSDLDVSRTELGARFRYAATELLAVWGYYRYLDFEDDAPYLYDTSGSVSFYSLGLAWTF